MPSLSALRAFHATAERGSFVNAAHSLNVTQAAVAQQVRGLEAELGLRLTERAGRSIRLTADGRQLAEALRDGFGRIAAGVDAVRAAEETRALRVSATPGITSKVLLPKLADFWVKHPGIGVTIVPDRRNVDLIAEGFDLAIRAVELDGEMPGTKSEVLVKSPIIAVASPDLISQRGTDPRQLPWLTRDEFELGALRSAGFDPDGLTFRNIGPPSLEPAAARMGYGVMICPEIMARADIATGDLVRLDMPDLGMMAYDVVTPSGHVRPSASAYIAWLRRQLTEGDMTAPLT